jgi:hypothetical protein
MKIHIEMTLRDFSAIQSSDSRAPRRRAVSRRCRHQVRNSGKLKRTRILPPVLSSAVNRRLLAAILVVFALLAAPIVGRPGPGCEGLSRRVRVLAHRAGALEAPAFDPGAANFREASWKGVDPGKERRDPVEVRARRPSARRRDPRGAGAPSADVIVVAGNDLAKPRRQKTRTIPIVVLISHRPSKRSCGPPFRVPAET